MKLTFTLTDGTTFEATKIKVGDSIKVTYINSEGKRMVYHLILTKKETMLLNK